MSKNNSRYLKQYCKRINTNYYIIRYLNSAITATINKPYDFMDGLIQYYFAL